MEGVRQYVISVVTSALICGIVSSFLQEGTGKVLIRLLCGFFLTATALAPVTDIPWEAIGDFGISYGEDASISAFAGERMAEDALRDIIKQQTEAYILDKAAKLNATITVDIQLDGENLPAEARFRGSASPSARARLREILESDLGITKENQIWTG